MSEARLILASQSARRAELLREAGYRFEQREPGFDDPAQPVGLKDQTVGELACALAVAKARSLAGVMVEERGEGERVIILAADTICVGVDGSLIGQPVDREDARRMIRGFEGRDHEVVTGATVWDVGAGRYEAFSDVAVVRFGEIDGEELERYLGGEEWRGKAGGYNLFDRQRAGWPMRCLEGSDPTTVVGLPMRKLKGVLGGVGIRS